MEGLEHIVERMTEVKGKLLTSYDTDVRHNLWLEFEALYFEFLDLVKKTR